MLEEELFHRALEKPTLAEQLAFLDQVCADQPELRQRVERLLRSHRHEDSFLHAGVTTDQLTTETVGSVIGSYKLLEQIGEGGMGTVWMAQQQEPVKRVVALKFIKAGMDSRQVIARFEAERQALALMDHANIARVLDAGTTSAGRPYFVMDLVKGVPITRYCDEHHLTPRQRLELFIPVCQAVQHAHQKGIIHRDLKPSNVLVALYDGKPVPKVIDFGVAKAAGQPLTEKTLVTGFGNIVGTLEYMSPEQAEINQLDIDTRSDIYSLGVLLYELLTGSPPFTRKELERAGMLEMLRVIREQEPSKPSTKLSTAEGLPTLAANRGTEPAKLTKLVRGELDWIVMKALEKDRNHRYETANGFAMDVQRYLADEAVRACPPSVGYRLRKFARRNKAGLAMAGLVLFFIVLLGGVVGWGMRDRAAREQEIAQEAARNLALTEQGIRQVLDRATTSHAELHDLLKKPGGLQQLLNQPARWELFLKTAQGELAQARRLAVRAEGGLDAELTTGMDHLEEHLTGDQVDYDLARRLEKIRLDLSTPVDGRFDYRKPAEEYRQVLAGFGVLSDDPAAAAARLRSSPIKEQLVAALDDWAWVAFRLREQGLPEQLLALARQVAPDPIWGDRLRQLRVWPDQEALGKLVAEVPAARLSPQLLGLVGLLLRDVNSPLAESWGRQAQAAHPADFWLNFGLGNALIKTSPVEAAGFYRVAMAVRPGNSTVYSNLGLALHNQGKLVESIAACRKAIELDPKHANAYSLLGMSLGNQGELDKAIAASRKAIELDPKHAKAHYNLGTDLYKQKKLDEAIAELRTATELEPKFAEAHDNLGIFLRAAGKLGEAIAAHRMAIELDPQLAAAHINLGIALKHQGKLDEAIASHKKAIELEPRFPKAHYNLGNALYDHGKVDEAIACYRKAIELDPDYSKARQQLAVLLATLAGSHAVQGEWTKAAADSAKAVELSPSDDILRMMHACFLLRSGDTIGYRQACNEMLERFGQTKDPIIAHRLAWTGFLLPDAVSNQKLLLELAQRSVDGAPGDPWTGMTLGLAQYRVGQYEQAIKKLQPYAKEWWCQIPVSLLLGMAHQRLGQRDEARRWFDMAAREMERETSAKVSEWLRRPDNAHNLAAFEVLRREAEEQLKK